ncbi:hypothetical protein [Mucilaginibacter sp. CSA2-8R]|uniref:hypothetical protein n=1 Tax=Mucilaginibacter sp. CSA2-8R TaxID=3141542 RepID=UPI00315C6F0C
MLFFAVILAIAIPIVLLVLFYRWMVRLRLKKVGIAVVSLICAFFAYNIYVAIYPNDAFYFDEFKSVTLSEIPASAEILNKNATYPDFHGEYFSIALIKLSKKDFTSVLNKVESNPKLQPGQIIWSSEFDNVLDHGKEFSINKGFMRCIKGEEDQHRYIGFLKDGETVVVVVVSIT